MLQIENVRKAYKTGSFEQVALNNVSTAFRDNEFVAILGPSGSGKTTLLNIIGGLDQYDSGDLIIDGISTKQYRDRDWDTYRNNRIGFVFQSYNLIPHQTVLSNVELALTLSGVSKGERRKRAVEALEQVGLGDHIHKKPNQLSGGQMQRVAVARALINDPEILLADEPTGALDSKTSVQIMDLLTRIADDRLVIMVTHNPELADQYANRTINLGDGEVLADSNPFVPTTEDFERIGKPPKRSKMNFITALALSFNNLMTKKGRTFMTAFAGSIGIIGIAAILALSNGVNNYVASVEESTLSLYPLTIRSTGIDMTALMLGSVGAGADDDDDASAEQTAANGTEGDAEGGTEQAATTDGPVKEMKIIGNVFSHVGSNDLAALKAWVDSGASGLQDYTNAIEYSYNVTPQIFSSNTEAIRQVNPDKSFSSLGIGGAMSGNAMMSMMGSTNIFSQLTDDRTLLFDQYDVKAGHWPENYNELVLVMGATGRVSDFVLYSMGLRDPKELDDIVKKFAEEEDITVPEGTMTFTYEELMAVKFKLVKAIDYYQYDKNYKVWKDKSESKKFLKKLVKAGEDLNIVGIVQANPDSSITSLSPGLYYTSDLVNYLIDDAAESTIVKNQIAKPKVNVFTGKKFSEENDKNPMEDFDMSSMFSIDEKAIAKAFNINPNALKIDPKSMTNLKIDPKKMPAMPAPDLAKILQGLNVNISADDIEPLITSVTEGYMAWCLSQTPPLDPTDNANLTTYLNQPAVQAKLTAEVGKLFAKSGVEKQIQTAFQKYMQQVMQSYMSALMKQIQTQMATSMKNTFTQLSKNMSSAMHIDSDTFASAFKSNLNEDDLSQIMLSFLGGQENTYENNLSKLGFADRADPSSIDIYPIDFESKQRVLDILDNYNKTVENDGESEKVITYTDLVGTLMSSVTEIVDMISMVLIAFVAISLIVSSIMIGIITYISVLERKKEIGILRSIGASKGDIGSVFNAETLIVGLISGVLGVGITALLCIPANAIVYAQLDIANIAILPLIPALVLVAISCVLTFLAGLIPAGSASRKDPVEALRSE